MYKIIRHKTCASHQGIDKQTIKSGLTLEEAQQHCKNPLTSSSTNPKKRVSSRYFKVAHWFDGYTKE